MRYIENLDVPQFFAVDACRAAGIEASTLKNWMTREPFAVLVTDEQRAAFADYGVEGPSNERLAGGSGRGHLFTYRRVLQIALTAELVRLGFSPRKACLVAVGFTDVGDTVAGWVGEPISRGRMPGQLFADGVTALIAYPGETIGSVENLTSKMPLGKVLIARGLRHAAFATIDVNAIDRQVRASLGLGADWAYDAITFKG